MACKYCNAVREAIRHNRMVSWYGEAIENVRGQLSGGFLGDGDADLPSGVSEGRKRGKKALARIHREGAQDGMARLRFVGVVLGISAAGCAAYSLLGDIVDIKSLGCFCVEFGHWWESLVVLQGGGS